MPATRILLVEDDHLMRQTAADYLRGSGFEVVEAANSMDALRIVESDTPLDVILTDLRLGPDSVHGYSLALMSKLRRQDIKVIYMTGTDPRLFALYSERDDVLRKPFDAGDLLRVVTATVASTAAPCGQSRARPNRGIAPPPI